MKAPPASKGLPEEGLNIAVDDDLLAAALEAVERRSRPAPSGELEPQVMFQQPDSFPPDDPTQDYLDSRPPTAEPRYADADVAAASLPLPPMPDNGGAATGGLDFGFLTEEWSRLEVDLAALRSERDDLLRVTRFGDEERRRLAAQLTRSVDRGRILERDISLATDARRSLEQRVNQLAEQCERQETALTTLRERRRREIEDQRLFGNSSMLQEMLPVVDNLRRAASFNDPESGGVQEGVRMVLTQFLQIMAGFGVTIIDAKPGAAFDPNYHEALAHHPVDADQEAGRIVEEITPGYLLNGRLLRAAQVTVSVRLAQQPAEELAPPDGAGRGLEGERDSETAASGSMGFAGESEVSFSASGDGYANLFGDPRSDVGGDGHFAPFEPSNSLPGDLGRDSMRPLSGNSLDDASHPPDSDGGETSTPSSSSRRHKNKRRAKTNKSGTTPAPEDGPTFPGDDPR